MLTVLQGIFRGSIIADRRSLSFCGFKFHGHMHSQGHRDNLQKCMCVGGG